MTKQQLIELCNEILTEADNHEPWAIEMARVALAALTQPAVLPDGWVAVPSVPTGLMCKAGCDALEEHVTAKATYQAMINAAPDAPHPTQIELIFATGCAP